MQTHTAGLIIIAALAAPTPGTAAEDIQTRFVEGRPNIATCCPPRDQRGRIKRSAKAKHQFARANACPSTGKNKLPCPGYRIDHTIPLKHCGADSPENMQWLTIEEWKSKSRWE